jgi:hypothetical protein
MINGHSSALRFKVLRRDLTAISMPSEEAIHGSQKSQGR